MTWTIRSENPPIRVPTSNARPSRATIVRRFLGRLLNAVVATVIVFGVLLLLDDSKPPANTGEQPTQRAVSISALSQSITDVRDPQLSEEIQLVRNFRDSVKNALADTDSELLYFPGQQQLAKRRSSLEKLLRNSGTTGLDDRLAEIDKAIVSQASAQSKADEEFVKKAIRELHETAISCKSGAIGDAFKRLGLSAQSQPTSPEAKD